MVRPQNELQTLAFYHASECSERLADTLHIACSLFFLPTCLTYVFISGRFPASFRAQCQAEGSNAGCQRDADEQRTAEIANVTLRSCECHSAAQPLPLTHVEYNVACVVTWQKSKVCFTKAFCSGRASRGSNADCLFYQLYKWLDVSVTSANKWKAINGRAEWREK